MSPDLTLIQRNGYTIVDIMSDVGGLQGILISAFSILLLSFNYKHLDSYLATKLYKTTAEVGSNEGGLDGKVHLKAATQTESIKECCIDRFLPR